VRRTSPLNRGPDRKQLKDGVFAGGTRRALSKDMLATVRLMHAHYDEQHLAKVIEQMREMGSPTLRAIETDHYEIALLEGCHRARAAAALGLPVRLEILDLGSYDCDALLDTLRIGLDCDNQTLRDLSRQYPLRSDDPEYLEVEVES
jgi:hypothetical protein